MKISEIRAVLERTPQNIPASVIRRWTHKGLILLERVIELFICKLSSVLILKRDSKKQERTELARIEALGGFGVRHSGFFEKSEIAIKGTLEPYEAF